MVKGFSIQHPPPASAPTLILDENMSNLTCASGDQASGASSSNQNATDGTYPLDHYLAPPPDHDDPLSPNPTKKRRNLPGNPDPDAEVVALSPRSLMATNRFVCEVCNKGFQRDQNLQLHRRGHNLPWKLKQRSSKEAVRKKVYVCPEMGCVHHDPKRALGDLTGIKKHFCRKHGEKKWKCDKCSKKYAVQSDWKAHSKTCGTREYKCDCGTLFSRRDSFITHRAFCDALAEENARAITGINPGPIHDLVSSASQPPPAPPQFTDVHHSFPFKREEISFPSWLVPDTSAPAFGPSGSVPLPMFTGTGANPSPNSAYGGPGPTFLAYSPAASASMSATALLQKAAQMGSTIGSGSDGSKSLSGPSPPPVASLFSSSTAMNMMWAHDYQVHVSAATTTTTGFGLHLSSRDHQDRMMMIMGLASSSSSPSAVAGAPSPSSAAFQQDIMLLNSLAGFDHHHHDDHHDHGDGSNYEDPFFGSCILDAKKEDGVDEDDDDQISGFHRHHHQLMMGTGAADDDGREPGIHGGIGGGHQNDGMTRDFLGLTALSHSDIMSIAGFGNCMNAPNSPSKQNP